MKVLDRIPASLLASRGSPWLILAAGPLTVSGVVWIANIISGTAFAESCGIGGVLVDAADQSGVLDAASRLVPLAGHVTPPTSSCRSVPFSADLPNMVLSVTAGLAVSVFVLFNLRLRLLRRELEASGLISPRSLERSGLTAFLEAGLPRRRHETLENIALLVVSVVGSAAMYFWLYTHGPIFRDLAGSYTHMGSSGVTTELLRQNWWANHTTHPINTALGIGVGAVGLFFALKQRSVFVAIGRWLSRLRSAQRPVEFVPRWLDRDYGWRPISGLVTLGYLAIFTFLASFSAALYALRSDQPGLSQWLSIVLAVIALFAAATNGVFIVTLIATIRRLFADSVQFERTRILAALREAALPTGRGRRRSLDRLYLLTEGSNLSDVPNYPVSGRWLRLLGVVPAFVGALWTFGNEVGRAFGI
jgi:hypothetical protein